MRVFTAFSGYDSQCMALDRLGMDYDLVGWSEIDRYAIRAHDAIYPQWSDRNYGDISKIDWNEVSDFDLFTYSFPCTDISSAGQQRGLEEGSGTRSSLLWECKKAIEVKKPKYLLMENVKALTQKKFLPYLLEWERYLGSLGYTNFTRVLNAKDYGVPQNRERVFMVSILGDGWYEFPDPFALDKRLKDVLEKDVDESYYLSNKMLTYLTSNSEKMERQGNGHQFKPKNENDIAFTIRTAAGSRIDDNFVNVAGNVNPSRHGMNGNIYDSYGLSHILTTNKREGVKIVNPVTCAMRGRNPENPSDRAPGIPTEQRIEVGNDVANCLTTVQKDSMVIEPSVLTPKRTDYGKAVRKDYESGDLKASRHDMTSLEPREDGISNTITTVQKDNLLVEPNDHLNDNCREIIGVSVHPYGHKLEFRGEKSIMPVSPTLRSTDYKCPCTLWGNNGEAGYRIRKLSPRECFRLMGVSESNIDKIQAAGISKTQQYKMAGNSIVVDVLYYIFRSLFVEKRRKTGQLSLF